VQRGRGPTRKLLPPLEECGGHALKQLDIVQEIWAPLRKLFAPTVVPSWLRASVRLAFHFEVIIFWAKKIKIKK